jgi:hypothetical protein
MIVDSGKAGNSNAKTQKERKRMKTNKHGLDAEKIRTEGNKGNEGEVNAEAQRWKDAKRTIDEHAFAGSSHSWHWR